VRKCSTEILGSEISMKTKPEKPIGIYAADGKTPLFDEEGQLTVESAELRDKGVLLSLYSMGGNNAGLQRPQYFKNNLIDGYISYSQSQGIEEYVGLGDEQHTANIIRSNYVQTLGHAIGKARLLVGPKAREDLETYINQLVPDLIGDTPFDGSHAKLKEIVSRTTLEIILKRFTEIGVNEKIAYCLIAAFSKGTIDEVSAIDFINSHWYSEKWSDWKKIIRDYIDSKVENWHALYAVFLAEKAATKVAVNSNNLLNGNRNIKVTIFGQYKSWAETLKKSVEYQNACVLFDYYISEKGAGAFLGDSLQRAVNGYFTLQEYQNTIATVHDKAHYKGFVLLCSQIYQTLEVQMAIHLYQTYSAKGKQVFFGYPREWCWGPEESREGFSVYDFFTQLGLDAKFVVVREQTVSFRERSTSSSSSGSSSSSSSDIEPNNRNTLTPPLPESHAPGHTTPTIEEELSNPVENNVIRRTSSEPSHIAKPRSMSPPSSAPSSPPFSRKPMNATTLPAPMPISSNASHALPSPPESPPNNVVNSATTSSESPPTSRNMTLGELSTLLHSLAGMSYLKGAQSLEEAATKAGHLDQNMSSTFMEKTQQTLKFLSGPVNNTLPSVNSN